MSNDIETDDQPSAAFQRNSSRNKLHTFNSLESEDVENDTITQNLLPTFLLSNYADRFAPTFYRSNFTSVDDFSTGPQIKDGARTAQKTLCCRLIYFLSMAGGRVIWVENARTLELVPVILRLGEAQVDDERDDGISTRMNEGVGASDEEPLLPPSLEENKSGNRHDDLMNNSDVDENDVSPEHRQLAVVMRIFYLFTQGVFAGFCFSTVYLANSATGDDTLFLTLYLPTAQENRRFCYLLSTISVIGSIETVMQLISRRRQEYRLEQAFKSRPNSAHRPGSRAMGNSSLKNFAVLAAIFYTIAFMASLAMSAQETRIAVQDGYYSPGGPGAPSIGQVAVASSSSSGNSRTASANAWIVFALADSTFKCVDEL